MSPQGWLTIAPCEGFAADRPRPPAAEVGGNPKRPEWRPRAPVRRPGGAGSAPEERLTQSRRTAATPRRSASLPGLAAEPPEADHEGVLQLAIPAVPVLVHQLPGLGGADVWSDP